MGAIFDRPQTPTKHRFDVDAYYKLAEAGILPNPHRVELIDGEIIDLNAMAVRMPQSRRVLPGSSSARSGTSPLSAFKTRFASIPITSQNPISWCCGRAPMIMDSIIPAPLTFCS